MERISIGRQRRGLARLPWGVATAALGAILSPLADPEIQQAIVSVAVDYGGKYVAEHYPAALTAAGMLAAHYFGRRGERRRSE